MPADTTVKFFHSAMTGAPVLSGTAGALKAVLDAVLLNGWGSATLDSLVIAGGIATATRAAGHPFEMDSVAQISGAVTTGGSVNGERRVLNVSGTSYTFDATGLPDQTATGSIQHRVAPLGWTAPFVAGNLAVYRTAGGAQGFLRVDDTGAQDARVRGFEAMTDVNTGTGPFPTVAQVSGAGLFWSKSEAASSAARAWMAWGDARTLYVALACIGFNQSAFNTQCFGDFRSYAASDPFAALLTGLAAANGSSLLPKTQEDVFSASTTVSQAAYAMRVGAGLAGSAQLRRVATHAPLNGSSNNLMSGAGDAGHYGYPNPSTGGLVLMPLLMLDPGAALRGVCRGVYYCPQQVGTGLFSNRQYVGDLPDLPDRKLRVVLNGHGPGFVDGTGPWP